MFHLIIADVRIFEKYVLKIKTSTATVDPLDLKLEVADHDFSHCSYVINKTCQYPKAKYVNKGY